MTTLLTPEQVVCSAFAESECLSADVVTEADIVAATSRYITPIVGQSMVEKLAEQEYPTLMDEYVAPALAAAVRAVIQPIINLRTGDSGLVAPKGESFTTPSQSSVTALQQRLKCRQRELLKRLSEHLNNCSEEYPEYDPECNILNRCSLDGGFVQIF